MLTRPPREKLFIARKIPHHAASNQAVGKFLE
jgi:hypothetical protein